MPIGGFDIKWYEINLSVRPFHSGRIAIMAILVTWSSKENQFCGSLDHKIFPLR